MLLHMDDSVSVVAQLFFGEVKHSAVSGPNAESPQKAVRTWESSGEDSYQLHALP